MPNDEPTLQEIFEDMLIEYEKFLTKTDEFIRKARKALEEEQNEGS